MALALPLIVVVAVLLAVSAFLSMSEAAFLAINKVRLRHLMQRGNPAAKTVYQLLTHLDRFITTVLVSNNLVNVTLTVLGTLLCIEWLGPHRGPVVASIVMTVLILVVGEITPKLFATRHADRTALILAWPLQGLIGLMRPVVALFNGISHALMRLFGESRLPRSPLVTEEELKVMMEMGREAGVLAEQELRLLHRILEFSDSTVQEAMVPRDEIAAVALDAKAADALDVLIEEGHSRIPVYRATLDEVVGVIYARDLLAMVRHGGLLVLPDLIRPVAVVPETKRLAELLNEFQRDRVQIAMVKNPQGATVGLVTIEDVLEEIVGEIHEGQG
ncbi:MAG: HlyC/CorC family transporter [Candidatus Omnitrophica bacterium]|nr:HlyC/CorC family transporter [Candidatus Omnitrophota bacterium]